VQKPWSLPCFLKWTHSFLNKRHYFLTSSLLPFLWEWLPIFCKIRRHHPQVCFKTWGSEKRKAWILHGQDKAILLRQDYPVKGIEPSSHLFTRNFPLLIPTAGNFLNTFPHSSLQTVIDGSNKMPYMQDFVERCRQHFQAHTNMVIADI